MHETELHPPVKAFFAQLGYAVRSEVDGCDLVARRGDEWVIVELKKSVNLTLILQGIDRKKMTETVYLAVAAPRDPRRKRWREVIRLCRLLGLGLLAVRPESRVAPVEVVCEPGPYDPRMNARRRHRLAREFEGRSADFNVGGSTGRPLVTAYREEALGIARYLKDAGAAKVAAVRKATGCEKAGSILQANYYGWFNRVSRGVYELTEAGNQALEEYEAVVQVGLRGKTPPFAQTRKSMQEGEER